jgi:biotin operon repressor
MLETSARLLRLLSLLQTRPDWTGQALADRLQVSARTIRSDVDKLRRLGYPVHATPGVAGGYRLGAGAALPPLLLDDEEAVAVAVGLRTAAGGTVTGIEETSLRALAKLEQVLPTRLRGRVNALHTHIVAASKGGPAWCTPAAAGTYWPGTPIGRTGAPSGSTGSRRAPRPGRVSPPGSRPAATPPHSSRGVWTPRCSGAGPG